MAFINAKIGGSLVDFEFQVDDTTQFGDWRYNWARGQVGQAPIGPSQSIHQLWETGKSLVHEVQATTCDVQN